MKWHWNKRIVDDGYAFIAVFPDGHREAYALYDEAYEALYGKEDDKT